MTDLAADGLRFFRLMIRSHIALSAEILSLANCYFAMIPQDSPVSRQNLIRAENGATPFRDNLKK